MPSRKGRVKMNGGKERDGKEQKVRFFAAFC